MNKKRASNRFLFCYFDWMQNLDKKRFLWYNIWVAKNILDPLAQMAEHMTFNHGVRSSTLRWVTKRTKSELFHKSKLVRICFLLLIVQFLEFSIYFLWLQRGNFWLISFIIIYFSAQKNFTEERFDLKRVKVQWFGSNHDTVHEMARDEAPRGKALEGLLNRYFKA